MNRKQVFSLWMILGLLLALLGCGAKQAAEPKQGVVYMDPNAATAAPAPVEAIPQPEAEATAAVPEIPELAALAEAIPQPEGAGEENAEIAPELELYFEGKGVRLEPWMEAAPALAALGEPIGSFEADSCAYIGKDMFYYYPGFELTVNEVEGVDRITAINVADDTVTTPQGIRIYDDEEKLLSLLGGETDSDVYAYQSGRTQLFVQVKDAEEGVRRIARIEYRVAEDDEP